MTHRTHAAELVKAITAVPGVRGIEPGIASTMRALDARVRAGGTEYARFGVVIDADGSSVTVEVGLDSSLPIRTVVRNIQQAALRALGDREADTDSTDTTTGTGAETSTGTGTGAGAAGSDSGPRATGLTASGRAANGPTVTVRVQSLSG